MRPNRTSLCASIAFIVATASASPSSAGDTPPAEALTDKAAALYEDGVLAYKKAKLAEARASFLAAWSLKKHWQIAASLADCEEQLGLHRDAAEHLAYFLRTAPKDQRTADIERLYKAARANIATLSISVDMPGADVAVDGKVIGKSPLEDPVFVQPGSHAVEARMGSSVVTAQVDAPQGAERPVALSVAPPAPKPSAIVVITGGVVTGIGLATGVALAVVAQGKGSAADAALAKLNASANPSLCQTSACATINSDRQAHDAFAKGALGAFITAGAVGVATLGYALLYPKAGTKVVPVVGSTGAGMAIVGAW